VELRDGSELTCPICGKVSKLYDHRKRRWRHLDSCNHKTLIDVDIPSAIEYIVPSKKIRRSL
ncbi:MAG: transposase family protein, partial [Spirochaetales bacterium]|nr:transposase family protein [Spirochaetales bacterium]